MRSIRNAPDWRVRQSRGSQTAKCLNSQAGGSGETKWPISAPSLGKRRANARQHRLYSQKEPTISMRYRLQEKVCVPFACRFQALNHAVLLPPIVSPARRALRAEPVLNTTCWPQLCQEHKMLIYGKSAWAPLCPRCRCVHDRRCARPLPGRTKRSARRPSREAGCLKRNSNHANLLHVVMGARQEATYGDCALAVRQLPFSELIAFLIAPLGDFMPTSYTDGCVSTQ